MLDLARDIYDQLCIAASGCVSCCVGLSRFDLWFAEASVSITGSMQGLLLYMWYVCVLGAAMRFLLFIGLVDAVTIGDLAML